MCKLPKAQPQSKAREPSSKLWKEMPLGGTDGKGTSNEKVLPHTTRVTLALG